MAAVSLFGKEVDNGRLIDVEKAVRRILGAVAAFLFTAGLFLSVFASAGLIPAMFEPGRIELLLSKPLSRTRLLVGRYLGTLAVIGSNMLYLVFGVWVTLGLKTGIWNPSFLLSAALAIFAFAVMLSVVTLVAVLSSSAVLATMVTCFFMLVSPLLAQHARIKWLFRRPWARELTEYLYYLFPKYYDLGNMSRLALEGRDFWSWMPVWSSAAFAAVMLAAGLWAFARKDY
jgi:ABC-type transport system involved in multi-copper enzyme maturation permease subunit